MRIDWTADSEDEIVYIRLHPRDAQERAYIVMALQSLDTRELTTRPATLYVESDREVFGVTDRNDGMTTIGPDITRPDPILTINAFRDIGESEGEE